MSEPDNFILQPLREIRAEMNAGFESNTRRFDTVEAKIESLKQAMHGEPVLGRYASAEFEDRIEAIEKRLDKLEKGH
ncbi:hypothetical protein KHC23_09530 [Ancylobacter dichloromethanicus]|uniref:Uncharacterized protein n=1 Tax=Ancylobacter dichloromethanicus TaxID=518825 RepID=A0A9W6J842_9HYPH|nr:hypothetical protein [Ancylobacter dichloromethanicus]MBS7553893.1 hypothetical protein [Ancylobacter dichloromethanicus]GLK71000.1 hypothetical protein GCM10017643_11150 [Ancylobacter dichloromethanicus]